MPRVLLIQMPFFRLDAPSLGLAMLEAALARAGMDCDLEHLNLDLGARVGAELYSWVAGRAPRHLLLGDLVFAPLLHDRDLDLDRVRALAARLSHRRDERVPDPVLDRMPAMAQAARDLVDDAISRWSWADYDLVGIGTFSSVVPALALARHVKRAAPTARVILGGSSCEGEMGAQLHRSFPFVDFVCRGEGEALIVELADRLAGGRAVEGIEGLIWRDDGATRGPALGARGGGASRADPYPLDRLPVPRHDRWLARARALGLLPPEELQLPIETSRGCWYGERRHCVFCGLNGERMRFRRKSPGRVTAEIDELASRGVQVLHCVDNVLDRALLKTVLPELARRRTGRQLFWEVRPDFSRSEMELLARSGVLWVQAGIESLSTPLLRRMGKGTTALQNVRFLRHAAELGIGASWSVLFGLPGEDPAQYDAMAALIPALSHLQPPRLVQQVRMDRFSPLFEERGGLTNVVPTPAYAELFPFDDDTVARLAYFFEFDYEPPRDVHAGFAACAAAIERWRNEVGRAALIRTDTGAALRIVDTRDAASARTTVLRGLERQVYLAAERGVAPGEIGPVTGASPVEVQRHVDRLLERRLAVLLDGRVLALAVPVDRWVPSGVPALVVDDVLRDAYCQRMAGLCRGYQPREGAAA